MTYFPDEPSSWPRVPTTLRMLAQEVPMHMTAVHRFRSQTVSAGDTIKIELKVETDRFRPTFFRLQHSAAHVLHVGEIVAGEERVTFGDASAVMPADLFCARRKRGQPLPWPTLRRGEWIQIWIVNPTYQCHFLAAYLDGWARP